MQFFWILFLVVVFVVSFISVVFVVSIVFIVFIAIIILVFVMVGFVMVNATVVLKKSMEIFEVHSRNRLDVIFFDGVGVVLTTWHEDVTVALNVTTENF